MARKKFKDPYDVRGVYPYEKGDHSPYWAWARKQARVDEFGNIIEPLAANVDQVADREPPEPSEEMEAISHVLNNGGLDKLTVRQKRAFRLVMLQGLTFREAGRIMSIRPQTVQEHVAAAACRLKKMCEDLI